MMNDDVNHDPHDCGTCPLVAPHPERNNAAPQPAPLRELSRRDFVSVATLSAIAVTLTACGGGELSAADRLTAPQTPTTPSTPSTPKPPSTPAAPGTTNPVPGPNQVGITVGSYPALATVGGVAKVNNNPAIALARTATGFVAYSLSCPHQGTTVTLQTGNTWRCPNHGALFAGTGAYTGGQQRTTNLVARTVTPNKDLTYVVVNLT